MKNFKIIIATLLVVVIGVGIFTACQKENLKQLEPNVDVQNEQTQKEYYAPDIDTVYYNGTIAYVDYSTDPPTVYYMWGWEIFTHSVFNYLIGAELEFQNDNGEPTPRIHLNLSTDYPGKKGELTTGYLWDNYEIVYVDISSEEIDHYLQMTVEFLNAN